jgi:hypothetical protein
MQNSATVHTEREMWDLRQEVSVSHAHSGLVPTEWHGAQYCMNYLNSYFCVSSQGCVIEFM